MKRKRYHIFTLGCQMNLSDSQRLAAFLDDQGYKEAKSENRADLIVINACSVRQKGIDRIFGKVRNYRALKNKAKLLLTGCILSKDRKKFEEKFDFIFEIGDFKSLENFIVRGDPYCRATRTIKWNSSRSPEATSNDICFDYFFVKPKYKKLDFAFVPIMTGCNNFCSYCVVPYTRGREKSRPMGDILKEVRNLVNKGCKKIVLLGQNVNSYDRSKKPEARSQKQEARSKNPRSQNKSDFVRLLERINNIPGDFEIEFLTSHPKDMDDDLIASYKNLEKLAPRLHLAMQSADDSILTAMNRKYSRTQFRGLISKIRKAQPKIFLSTDIIVGFPGETKKQFENTVRFCRETKFNKAYVSMYSPRAGTSAAKLVDNVSLEEKKRRWKMLDLLINKKQGYEKIQDTRIQSTK